LTFNLAQIDQGQDKIRPTAAEYPFLGFLYSLPREPSEIPASGGFRFVGQRIQCGDYLAIFSFAAFSGQNTLTSTGSKWTKPAGAGIHAVQSNPSTARAAKKAGKRGRQGTGFHLRGFPWANSTWRFLT
jgi:hypothetical protein